MPETTTIVVESIVKETEKSIRVKSEGRNYNCAKSVPGWEQLKTIGDAFVVETYQSPFEYNGKEVMMTWIESLVKTDKPTSGGGGNKGGGGGYGSSDASIERQVALKEAGATFRTLIEQGKVDVSTITGTDAYFKQLYATFEHCVSGALTADAVTKAAKEKLGATEEPDPPKPPKSGADIGDDDDIPF